jgi:predicted nucleic acid-binding protein
LRAFVDSSAFYAAADDGDRSNARSRELFSQDSQRLLTTDHVIIESWLLLQRRLGAAAAEQFWGAIRGGAAAVEHVTATDLEAAWAIGERFPDQSFSIVDRTSFAVMERLAIHRAIAFDDDFAVYRFGPRRDRAFEVLR